MPKPHQIRLPLPGKPKPADASVQEEKRDALNRAGARIILQHPEQYGGLMTEWATKVLASSRAVSSLLRDGHAVERTFSISSTSQGGQ